MTSKSKLDGAAENESATCVQSARKRGSMDEKLSLLSIQSSWWELTTTVRLRCRPQPTTSCTRARKVASMR